MPKSKSYKKSSDKPAVLKEMSMPVPMIVRIHKVGCSACENSQGEWEKFCQQSPPGMRVVEVEEQAVPPEIMNGIEGFPTYAVHKDGKSWHHTGALEAGAIQNLVDHK